MAVAVAVVASVLAVPTAVTAAPAPTKAQLEAKQRQRADAIAQLQASKAEVTQLVREYVELGREMSEAQVEIVQVEAEIAAIEMELDAKERAFTDRAVQLYRSDRAGLLEVLLGSSTFQDFWTRAHYLFMVNQRDTQLMQELRLARSESLWLQNHLGDKVVRLTKLQNDADTRRVQIEERIDALQATADELGEDIAELMKPAVDVSGGTPSGEFDRNTVISDLQFRDHDSMSVVDIQAFLNRQPGTLKSYRTADHLGRTRSVAEMVAEAATAWRVNPKVILVKLQKEQSLLGDASPSREQYDWALGCGKADSKTYYQYQGFGKQIWYGAEKLDKNADPWKPGISMKIDKTTIYPTNESTYSLYKYTPHFKGTMSFWLIYWRYFGDPLAPLP